MQPNLRLLSYPAGIIIFLLAGCRSATSQPAPNPYPSIGAIPLPAGYHRIPVPAAAFAAWLRNIPLKKDRTVYLFNGVRKSNQNAQFAVLDITVGKQDLQQCADAVMRLRSEYLYSRKNYLAIDFYTGPGKRLNFEDWRKGHELSRSGFDEYLRIVFTYCGTQSLEKQLLPVPSFPGIFAGDVLIKGGSPGHAMLVADIAEDNRGHRLYLLAQSYMPAQDIHIVNNPADPALSPWYRAESPDSLIITPEWTFKTNQLRTWPSQTPKL